MRRWIALFVIGVSVAATLPSTTAHRAEAQALPPNVLVILTDDQRRNGTLAPMDSLRRIFRRRGTDFTDAYATTPLCCPSRASIWTGLYAHNHGVQNNEGGQFADFPQDRTLQAYLQGAGYTTAYFGKYFNRWPLEEPPPYFDRWAINTTGSEYRFQQYNVNGAMKTIARYDSVYLEAHLRRFVTSAESDDGRPWFVVLSLNAPHAPSSPQERYLDAPVGRWRGNPAVLEEDRTDKHPDVQLRNASLWRASNVRRNQLRTLLSVDDTIEDVFSVLGDLDETPDTLAFYLSDNGFLWGEHRVMAKREPFTQSTQIPLFARGPGVQAGAIDERLVANIDVAPTILEAAGITPSEPMDGRSLFATEARDRLLLEYWTSSDFGKVGRWASTLTPTYQYVEYYEDSDPSGSVPTFREYYDLVEDPWQLENLFGDGDLLNDPEPVALTEQLSRDRSCAGENCP